MKLRKKNISGVLLLNIYRYFKFSFGDKKMELVSYRGNVSIRIFCYKCRYFSLCLFLDAKQLKRQRREIKLQAS